MKSQNRDDKIRNVLEHLKFARWKDLKKETGLSDGTLFRGLTSLMKQPCEVLKLKNLYALTKYRDDLEREE